MLPSWSLTHGAGEFARPLLEQPHDLGFLRGGAAAAHDSGALARQLHELVLVVLQAHLVGTQHTPDLHPALWAGGFLQPGLRGCPYLQRVPRDDQGAVVLAAEGVQLQVGFSSVCHLGEDGTEQGVLHWSDRTTKSPGGAKVTRPGQAAH